MSEEIPLAPHEELEMAAFKTPTPKDLGELVKFIDDLVEREHDYGTCVYAMSHAATAAFNFVARKLGVTGFQASCADLDIIKRTRSWNGPFLLLNGEDLLYPQYDLPARLDEWIEDTLKEWGAEQARLKLAEHEERKDLVHPHVKQHWEKLAK